MFYLHDRGFIHSHEMRYTFIRDVPNRCNNDPAGLAPLLNDLHIVFNLIFINVVVESLEEDVRVGLDGRGVKQDGRSFVVECYAGAVGLGV